MPTSFRRIGADTPYEDAIASINNNFAKLDGRTFKLVTVITGSYTLTTPDFANMNTTITVPHNLNFKPYVAGSIQSSTDSVSRVLPFNYFADGENYFGMPSPSAYVTIDKVDDTNITLRLVFIDSLGLSLFLANSDVLYKLFCLRDTVI